MAEGFSALDPCVHCGFCLPACPTFLATGDEADSPRGRIVLMRALERGEIGPDDVALKEHLDACLGCRGCEPVCPSGVGYGRGLEAAREMLARHGALSWKARSVLAVFRHRWLWKLTFTLSRLLRATGLPRVLARRQFNLGMLAATRPAPSKKLKGGRELGGRKSPGQPTVLLFRGCVMDRLFDHVHDATRRTLEVNGYHVVESTLPQCCGALHMHAGDRASAEKLAGRNVDALTDTVNYIAVNSAGCGAMLKDYAHLVPTGSGSSFAARVRDISELLAVAGPRQGAAMDVAVAYDAPCHLQHAQRVHGEVLALFKAIPQVRVSLLPGFDRCCGSAGIYSMLHPDMSRAVLSEKIQAIIGAEPRPQIVATGNPGCLMQIGAGLLEAGMSIPAMHPVELLDESYRRAGFYA